MLYHVCTDLYLPYILSGRAVAKCFASLPLYFYEYWYIRSGDVAAKCAARLPQCLFWIFIELYHPYMEWRCCGKACRKFAIMHLWIFICLYHPYTEWRCFGKVCRKFARMLLWIFISLYLPYTEWRCYGNVCRRFAKRFPWILMNWLVCHSIAKKQIWSVTECRSFASG